MLSYNSIKNNNKLYDELLIFKYKLETRYNDYRNRGLNEQYFINILNQNQEELINKIDNENEEIENEEEQKDDLKEEQKEDIKEEQKEDIKEEIKN